MFVSKFKKAELNREFDPGKLRMSMSSADTDEVPKLRNHKSARGDRVPVHASLFFY